MYSVGTFDLRSRVAVGFFVYIVDLLAFGAAPGTERCLTCHPKEVKAYAQSAMALALRQPISQPSGTFEHVYSQTTFRTYEDTAGLHQTLARHGEEAEQRIAYVIGSGSQALGYLVRIGDHLFQSPLCYYTQSRSWGMAPGYELDPRPDFSRPVPVACVLCHSGRANALAGAFNRYADRIFSDEGITCERCHGPSEQHLRRPVAGSIVNPRRLMGAPRDSICEQCHLAGEVRIANPGKKLADYVPGDVLEDTYTIYVRARPANGAIKVVSHAEQLALSTCARRSSGKLWCGGCHKPHETVNRKAEYFRERCLSCHGATLEKGHAAEGRDCVACHMARKPTSDGGHTIFTDHRIARHPEDAGQAGESGDLRAWREPAPEFRERNLGLALADFATQKKSASGMVEAFRLLHRVENDFSNDPAVLAAIGSLLFIAEDAAEAEKYYRKAVARKPDFAPYQVNLGAALLKEGKKSEAREWLEKSLRLDPVSEAGTQLLSRLFEELGEREKADALRTRYRQAMGYKR